MIVIYIVLGIILLVLILGLIVSKDMNYEKSIEINANIDKVWEFTNSMSGLDKWNPWNKKDPNMEKVFSGMSGAEGESQSWVSKEKNVGEGKQTITKVEKPNLLETKLEFIKPFKSVADAYVKLAENNDSTAVSWGFKSTMPYPMNLMKLFMNFEKNMDVEFGQGLNKLKDLCEK